MYAAAHADRLAFIRQCRKLDMALDEIRSLLRLRDAPFEDCGEVNNLLDQHIGHVAQHIRELRKSTSAALTDPPAPRQLPPALHRFVHWP